MKTLGTISTVIVLLLAILFALCEANKAYWDYRVQKMCEKDGGIQVLETIRISHSQFIEWGGRDGVRGVPIPFEINKRREIPVFQRGVEKAIRAHFPYVGASVFEVVRIHDGKVLGRATYFHRRGGDFPAPWHESFYSCQNIGLISEKIILVEGSKE